MAIPSFVPVKSTDRVITAIQNALSKTLAALVGVQLSGGVLKLVTFPAAALDVTVYHNLGVPNVTFIEGDKSVPGFIYRSSTVPPFPLRSVVLRASAPMTATIWFFPQ